MNSYCSYCNNILDNILHSDDESISITCTKCGIINHLVNEVKINKNINVLLIKTKLKNILDDDMFKNINDSIKNDIIELSLKIGPHVKSTLISFILLYLEYKNLMNFKYDFVIKKKQRKNIIKILIEINKPSPTIFIRTPITYITFNNNVYNEKEIKLYHNVSNCLIYLNICNKKNLYIINQKIHEVIESIRNNTDIIISNSLNYIDIIKYIICYNITVDDIKDSLNYKFD